MSLADFEIDEVYICLIADRHIAYHRTEWTAPLIIMYRLIDVLSSVSDKSWKNL